MIRKFSWLIAIGLFLGTEKASATFHFMQIEQVIGGVNGDLTAQAIQLRMRAASQQFVSASRVVVRDATGSNPVLIHNLTTDVAVGLTDRRVLLASANFLAQTSPATVADFPMTNLIPASYLCAGTLTFEDDFGTVYWRLSWGGASYTGTGAGNIANDSDGNFNPPFAGPLPTSNLQALQFTGSATALSTNNAAQYALTTGASVWRNNANTVFTLVGSGAARGACCNGLVCSESVTAASCSSPQVWTQGLPCCSVTCSVTGACCDPSMAACTDDVAENDCDPPMIFTANMDCADVVCVPTLSEWGLLVLALTILSAGTVVLRKKTRYVEGCH